MAKQPRQAGNWVSLFIEPQFPWPESETLMPFRGHKIWLLPVTEDCYPMVAIECGEHKATSDEGYRVLRRFISALVWMESRKATIVGAGGGTYPYRMQMPPDRRPPGTMDIQPHYDNLPEPEDERALLGLALYREAMESENVAYQVLGFAKVFNVLYRTSAPQIEWINSNLDKVNLGRARLAELQEGGTNVGEYLYSSCRCAVAHAYADPLINPDEPGDYKRLGKDLPLVKELSEIAIEYELGVKSATTVYREHLYELAGFRELLGNEALALLKGGNLPADENIDIPDCPRLTIRLRDEDPYNALVGMEVTEVEVRTDGMVRLRCDSANRVSAAFLYLNFPQERLQIDVEGGFAVFDVGTPEAARFAADVSLFKGKYFMNGALEVWDADNNRLLGRCDPFIPMNIMPVETWKNFEAHAKRFMEIAAEREQSSSANVDTPCDH